MPDAPAAALLMRHPPHAFWRFSLRVYRAPGVQAACLALQEDRAADVNLLLLCGWLGRRGRSIDKRHLRAAMRCVGNWQSDVIAPVREARRAIKRVPPRDVLTAEKLHRRILALELDLEFIEQSMLAELVSRWPAPARQLTPEVAIIGNLKRYLLLLAHELRPMDTAHLARIALACSEAPQERPAG